MMTQQQKICKAVEYGDAILLHRILSKMEPRERASALATRTLYARGGLGRVCNIICTPLVAAAEYGHLLCVKTLLFFHADVEGNNTFLTPLFAAVAGGYLDIMNCLVENGANVNARTYHNCTPLIRASALGDIDAVTYLMDHGANVNLQDKDGETALHYAIRFRRNSYNDVLSCLIKHGADVNARSNDDVTPLLLATVHEDLCAVTFLVEHGADINLQGRDGETALSVLGDDESDQYLVNNVLKYLVKNGADVNTARTHDKCTHLMRASAFGNIDGVTFLVEHGANVNLQDEDGKTALHYAICCRRDPYSDFSLSCPRFKKRKHDANINVVTFLVEHGADINLQDSDGKPALFFGVDECDQFLVNDVLKCLVENGADVNTVRTRDKCTLLMRASEIGNIDVVTLLVEQGTNVYLQDKDGMTALHYAVRCRDDSCNDVLSCLIKNGADVNARSNDDVTPLMLATKYANMNAVTCLVEHGAGINLQDSNGKTVLFFGVDGSDQNLMSGVFKYLVETGADVNARTKDRCTHLMRASELGNIGAVTFLVEHGANVNLEGKYRETALHYAVRCRRGSCSDVLSCLIKHGADVNVRSGWDVTPLMLASECANIKAVTFLVEHGADINLQDSEGKTAFFFGVNGYQYLFGVDGCDAYLLKVFKYLMENGADVNTACTDDKCTPLMRASELEYIDGVTFFAEHGAKVNLQDKDGLTALHYAVRWRFDQSYNDVLSCLIKHGADVNARSNDDVTPLMLAAENEDMSAVTFLVEHGAGINLQDREGKTALFFGVDAESDQNLVNGLLKYLIENGADVNACTYDNCTPLMRAKELGNMEVVTFLVEHGANVNLHGKDGKTALQYN